MLTLIEGANVSVVNAKGQTPLHQAIVAFDGEKDDKALFAIMEQTNDLDHQDIEGNNPLLVSLIHGHINIAIKLIGKGADIFVVNAQGQSVIELTLDLHSLPMINALIERGFDFNTVGSMGEILSTVGD